MDIESKSLKIQDYLLDGNKNIELSKLIFKARGQTLDIKTQKKWRYSDNVCTGCDLNVETIEEILSCSGLIKHAGLFNHRPRAHNVDRKSDQTDKKLS